MFKRLLLPAVAPLFLTFSLAFSPAVRAQTAADNVAQDKWNNVSPLRSTYAGKKSGPAPVRDISGIWDAAYEDGGRQTSGAKEHPAVLPQGGGTRGGQRTRPVLLILCLILPRGLRRSSATCLRGPA